MDDTAKYLIHADITADGIVERSDVVGAVFGQTEGLLGSELDIRTLQQSSKLGRIDVEIDSENGQSFGHLTIASELDQVETAVLAAALETIDRVGPCRAEIRVTNIQDARAAKRETVIGRAEELLATAFDDSLSSADLLEEVRANARTGDVTEYEGFPAGPRVSPGDAIIIVEGRADVVTLLRYGIKNAVAIEGTNVPDAVADLSRDCTTTAFLDGDRGGDLILRELEQVAEIDYVARAPDGRSVEDLSHAEAMAALREKVPVDAAAATDSGREVATDGAMESPGVTVEGSATADATVPADDAAADATDEETAPTLAGHVEAVVGDSSGVARLLDGGWELLAETGAERAFEAVESAEEVPHAVVLDGTVTQRLLDVAAQRGVRRLVGRERGQFTKQPSAVRVHTAEELS